METSGRNDCVVCSKCGEIHIRKIWDVINSSHYGLRQKILNDDLFKFECQACGETNYKPYPFTYVDKTNDFAVVYDASCANLIEKTSEIDKLPFKKIIAVNSLDEVIVSILSYERGYDPRRIMVGGLLGPSIRNDDLELSQEELNNCILAYENTNDCIIVNPITYTDSSGNKHSLDDISDLDDMVFTIEEVDNMLSSYKPKLDTMLKCSHKYIFNTFSAYKYVYMSEEEFLKSKELYCKLAICEVNDERYICHTLDIYPNQLKIGDKIIACKFNQYAIATITNFITMKDLECPYDVNCMPVILGKYDESLTMEGKIIDCQNISNLSELGLALSSRLKLQNTIFIELWDKDVYIASHLKGRKTKSGNVYLVAYSNEMIAKDENLICVPFKKLSKYVYNNCHSYNGLILATSKSILRFNIGDLADMNNERIMTNPSNMVKLIQKLNEKEKEFLGKLSYESIYHVYVENKNINEVVELLEVTRDEVEYSLGTGYSRLKRIIECNHWEEM